MSWLGKLDRLTDAQVRQVAYLLADCAEQSEPVTEARMDRWVARFGPSEYEPCRCFDCRHEQRASVRRSGDLES